MKPTHVRVLMDTGASHASTTVLAGHKRHVITTVFVIKPRDCVHVTPTGAEMTTVPHARLAGMALIAQWSSTVQTITLQQHLDMVTS